MIGYDKAPLMSWKGFELIAEPWEKLHGLPSPTIHRLGSFVPAAWEAILSGKPYPITAAITLGGNPMMWAANTRKCIRLLRVIISSYTSCRNSGSRRRRN